METILKITAGAFIGTSLMTSFSYLLSNLLDKQFREPVLLNSFLQRHRFFDTDSISAITGWFIHYGMGFLFVFIYHFIWSSTAIDPNLISGSLLGFINGLVGLSGWALVFHNHPKPPSIDKYAHYLHLVFAHILFGIGATVGYALV